MLGHPVLINWIKMGRTGVKLKLANFTIWGRRLKLFAKIKFNNYLCKFLCCLCRVLCISYYIGILRHYQGSVGY